MKKILLISDTHGHLDPKLQKYINEADEIWHGGDIGDSAVSDSLSRQKPFRAVYGNIDGTELRSIYPENNIFFCEEVKVLITHIGGYPEKYPARISELLRTEKPEIFICGHSHILKVMYDRTFKLLHINPGAAGMQGFHQVKTAIRFEIDGQEIKNLDVIELGKRTG